MGETNAKSSRKWLVWQGIFSALLIAALIETGVFNTIVYHAWPYSVPMYVLCLAVWALWQRTRREVRRLEAELHPEPVGDKT